ncbi:MAG: hypothetical protein ACU0GG_02300 [Paracoccaceae bacterium]
MVQTSEPFADIFAMKPAVLAGWMAVNPVAGKAWLDLMAEGTQFLTDRAARDRDFQQRLMACRSSMDVAQLQVAYMFETMDHCAAAITRSMDMMAAHASAIGADARTGHKRAYNDVPV